MTLYLQGLEGAAVSDKDGVCVISFAVEGKEARLDPLMRCDTLSTTGRIVILTMARQISLNKPGLNNFNDPPC